MVVLLHSEAIAQSIISWPRGYIVAAHGNLGGRETEQIFRILRMYC